MNNLKRYFLIKLKKMMMNLFSLMNLILDLQEILQVYLDAELRGPELQRWREPSVPAQHNDGPEEVLQPSLPVPRGCCGTAQTY